MVVQRDTALSVNSLYVAVSSASFAAVAPFFYRSTTRSGAKTALLVPALCGSFSAAVWHHLFTKPIDSDNLHCAACASARGAAVAALTGCILPSVTVACVRYGWKPFRNFKHGALQLCLFVEYCLYPYSNSRPLLLGFGGFQAVLGYCLASWQFDENFAARTV